MPLTLSTQPSSARNTAPLDEPLAALVVVIGLVLTLILGGLSTGYHHVDDLTHFLFARWAWLWPKYLLHDWGRPGFTILYFIPAWFGWHAARAWSAMLSAATAWMAFRVAQHLGVRRAWLVPLFVYVQPRFFTLCTTTLTETALGFYLLAATLLALRQRWSAAAAVYSLGLIARHEAVALLPVFVLAAWAARQPLRNLWPLLWAPVLLNVLALFTGMQTAMGLFSHPAGSGQYGRGPWYEFFCRTLEAFGPAIGALGLAGMARTLRRPGGGLVVALIGVYFVAQSMLRAFGLYGSGGYARFLVPIGPLWAIPAVITWNRLTHSDPRVRARTAIAVTAALAFLLLAMELEVRFYPTQAAEIAQIEPAKRVLRFATLAIALITVAVRLAAGGPRSEGTGPSTLAYRGALAALMAIGLWGLCGVLRPGPQEQVIDEELAWLHDNGYDRRALVTSHPWADYRRGTALSPERPNYARRIDQAAAGAIILWDAKFAPNDQGPVALDDLTARNTSFRLLHVSRPLQHHRPEFYLFEKIADGAEKRGSRGG